MRYFWTSWKAIGLYTVELRSELLDDVSSCAGFAVTITLGFVGVIIQLVFVIVVL